MSGTGIALLVVLATAALHAGWNVAAKAIGDRWVTSLLIGAASAAVGLVGVVLTAATIGLPDRSSWLYMLGSAVLQCVYLLTLTRAYGHGEVSRLYPIARGTSPIVVTMVAVGLLHERLTTTSWWGLIVLILALALLAVARGLPRPGHGLGLAALTGVVIAAYTLLDGVGVRTSGAPLAYIAWLFALHGPMLLGVSLWRIGPGLRERVRPRLRLATLGGVMAVAAYGIVVWAQSVAPTALVAAIRETSVIWGVVIARLTLHEQLRRREVAAIVLAAGGAVLLQVGSG